MINYQNLLQHILDFGELREDRTKVGTLAIFGHQMRFDLQNSFPLVTSKKVHFKALAYELLWMLKGDTNIKYLQDNNVRIWDDWADASGDLGPVYGKQWRRWGAPAGKEIDQLANTVEQIKSNPHSRRLIVNAWNVGELESMALPPCPTMFQFFVSNGYLSCQVYQRSADCFLGLPFDIASYALLTKMVAQVCGLKPKELIHTLGDAHIYLNHLEQVKIQISRTPKPAPTLELNPNITDLFDFEYSDIKLINYQSHEKLVGAIAV
jgi:thymidylate synthase